MKKFDSINVIPFIDIMLVLLAIVLTTATFVSTGELDIDLPVASDRTAPDESERIEISIDRNEVFFLDGVETSLEELEKALIASAKDTAILLTIDETVDFKRFVSVIDLLNTLGLDKVSILTRNNG